MTIHIESDVETVDAKANVDVSARSEFRRIIRVFLARKVAVAGLAIIAVLVLVAILAPVIAPHNPYQISMSNKLLPPSWEHPLGTDFLGRDTLSRLLYASRTSLLVGVLSMGCATVVGVIAGLVAAFFGGWVNHVIMRLTDALMAIPGLMLSLLIAGLVGGGMKTVVLAMAVGQAPVLCRLMCGQSLSVKENDYVRAARVIGMGNLRTMATQIFPNAFPPILVAVTLGMGAVILGEAALSFLGIGIVSPTCAWGSMINEGYKYLLTNPLLSIAPGVAIMLTVFGFNMAGDGLRDAIDPRLRGIV